MPCEDQQAFARASAGAKVGQWSGQGMNEVCQGIQTYSLLDLAQHLVGLDSRDGQLQISLSTSRILD